MSTNLKDKVIVVTGAGGGMGIETAKMLSARGAKVSMGDVQEATLFAAAAEIEKSGGQVMAQVVDVTSRASVEDWIKKTVARFGKLDGAANLAGILPRGFGHNSVENQDDEDWDRVIGVNLTGVMYCMRAELAEMNDFGSIVNASSVAGIQGFACNASYGASKFGVVGLTKCAAKDVGPSRSIRVNCIAPGTIATPMYEQVKVARGGQPMDQIQQIKRDGQAHEIASLVCWLLCDESSFITGQVQQICGGYIC